MPLPLAVLLLPVHNVLHRGGLARAHHQFGAADFDNAVPDSLGRDSCELGTLDAHGLNGFLPEALGLLPALQHWSARGKDPCVFCVDPRSSPVTSCRSTTRELNSAFVFRIAASTSS